MMLGHSSVRITEKHCAPWVKERPCTRCCRATAESARECTAADTERDDGGNGTVGVSNLIQGGCGRTGVVHDRLLRFKDHGFEARLRNRFSDFHRR